MEERSSDFTEFAEYLFNSQENEKIHISLETSGEHSRTEKTDLFEFCLNLLIFGYKKNKTLEEIQKYFEKINIKLEYYFDSIRKYSPYEITKKLKLIKNYNADDLFALYEYNNQYIYFSFKY
jgi:pyruvate-formate lyase-activating enzyme